MKHIFFISLFTCSFFNFTAEEPLKINSGTTVTEIEDPQIKTVLHFRKNITLDPHSILNFKKPHVLFHELCAHAAALIYTNKNRCIINTLYKSKKKCEHLRLIIEALISLFHYELRHASLSSYNSSESKTQRRVLLSLTTDALEKVSIPICDALKKNYHKIIGQSHPIIQLSSYLWHTLWSLPWYKELETDTVFDTNSRYLKIPGNTLMENNAAQYMPHFGFFSSMCITQGWKAKTVPQSKKISADSIYEIITKYTEALTTVFKEHNATPEILAEYIKQVTNAFLQTYSKLCASNKDLENNDNDLKKNHGAFILLMQHMLTQFINTQLSTEEKINHIQQLLYLCLYLSPSYCIMLTHPSFTSQKMDHLHAPSLQFFKQHLNPCTQQETVHEEYTFYCAQDAYRLGLEDFTS